MMSLEEHHTYTAIEEGYYFLWLTDCCTLISFCESKCQNQNKSSTSPSGFEQTSFLQERVSILRCECFVASLTELKDGLMSSLHHASLPAMLKEEKFVS